MTTTSGAIDTGDGAEKDLAADLRAIASMYGMLDKEGKDLTSNTISSLRSQMRLAVAKRKAARHKASGTQSIVDDSHPKRARRTFNTHHEYYRQG